MQALDPGQLHPVEVRVDARHPTAHGMLRLVGAQAQLHPVAGRVPLGELLRRAGVISDRDLRAALRLRPCREAPLGQILMAHGLITAEDLTRHLARQWQVRVAALDQRPPDPALLDRLDPARCLRAGLVPWRRLGGVTLIATAHPDKFDAARRWLEPALGPVAMTVATEEAITRALHTTAAARLVAAAETRCPEALSCRPMGAWRWRVTLGMGLAGLGALTIAAPGAVFVAVFSLALVLAGLSQLLKIAATCAARRPARAPTRQTAPGAATSSALTRTGHPRPPRQPDIAETGAEGAIPLGIIPGPMLPAVSMLVPLYHEHVIAGRLLHRLRAQRYPPELLEICLIVEAGDDLTRATLARTRLPRNARVVVVPPGALRTKPRAMNFALDHCRGSIIGIWDAEDAPEPDQVMKAVQGFAAHPPQVGCLQGVLDIYNSRSSWLSRCFAIDYGIWFRLVLPGIARLGLAVPLGGTTVFFRRAALEAVGGWDAHNVTEDADLGLRLRRAGYRTEMIGTVTQEEATRSAWPWIRQRSRWIKGYAMTWAVHMRAPVQLWRAIGPRAFFGVQLMFAGAVVQTLAAPVLWSAWAIPLGLPHPLRATVVAHPLAAGMVATGLALCGLVNMVCGMIAVSRPQRRHLRAWVPALMLYYPLATLAAWKALAELIWRPFFWDKTAHGLATRRSQTDRLPAVGGNDATGADAPHTAQGAGPGHQHTNASDEGPSGAATRHDGPEHPTDDMSADVASGRPGRSGDRTAASPQGAVPPCGAPRAKDQRRKARIQAVLFHPPTASDRMARAATETLPLRAIVMEEVLFPHSPR